MLYTFELLLSPDLIRDERIWKLVRGFKQSNREFLGIYFVLLLVELRNTWFDHTLLKCLHHLDEHTDLHTSIYRL